jgi:septal ring factor EnvC (AmiA/AmiB activator)
MLSISGSKITIYTQLEELFKSKGDQVEADEVIAAVGDAGSMNGPGLHFEVRHHPHTFRSSRWIVKKVKKELN